MIWMFILGSFFGFALGLIIMSLWIISSYADEQLALSAAERAAPSETEGPAFSFSKGLEHD